MTQDNAFYCTTVPGAWYLVPTYLRLFSRYYNKLFFNYNYLVYLKNNNT